MRIARQRTPAMTWPRSRTRRRGGAERSFFRSSRRRRRRRRRRLPAFSALACE